MSLGPVLCEEQELLYIVGSITEKKKSAVLLHIWTELNNNCSVAHVGGNSRMWTNLILDSSILSCLYISTAECTLFMTEINLLKVLLQTMYTLQSDIILYTVHLCFIVSNDVSHGL